MPSIDPFSVRFSQKTVNYRFRDEQTIDDLADLLRRGTIDPETVPAVRLTERNGLLYTLDNRRLEAFRRAECPIPYRFATAEEAIRERWKFTTMNDGTSVEVRGT